MKLYFFSGLILFSFSCFAQNKNIEARNQIDLLKNGALLIRLKSGEMQAKALENGGSKAEAQAYLKKQAEQNQALMHTFRTKFTFCPLYFFYSSSSTQVQQKEFHACFLNEQLLPDSTIAPPAAFLVGEIGYSNAQHLDGFILMDDQLVQLRPPFPWIARKFESAFKSRSDDEMILTMNKNLWEFYKKNH